MKIGFSKLSTQFVESVSCSDWMIEFKEFIMHLKIKIFLRLISNYSEITWIGLVVLVWFDGHSNEYCMVSEEPCLNDLCKGEGRGLQC